MSIIFYIELELIKNSFILDITHWQGKLFFAKPPVKQRGESPMSMNRNRRWRRHLRELPGKRYGKPPAPEEKTLNLHISRRHRQGGRRPELV